MGEGWLNCIREIDSNMRGIRGSRDVTVKQVEEIVYSRSVEALFPEMNSDLDKMS